MKNKLKLTLLVLCIACIACLLALAGCGPKATDAYITSAGQPRLNYVQGQELDLSTGYLTVVIDGEDT